MQMLFLLILMLLLPFVTLAEVYKWVDENGNVHYGDRPSGQKNQSEEMFDASKANASFIEQDGNPSYQKKLLKVRESERAERKAAAAKDKKAKEQAKRKCIWAKDRLTRAQNARYLYNLNDEGERIIYNEEQRTAAIAKWRARVDKFCKK